MQLGFWEGVNVDIWCASRVQLEVSGEVKNHNVAVKKYPTPAPLPIFQHLDLTSG